MKRSRLTEQQIAFALQQAESGTPVGDVCRKMGISEQTFFRWKKRFGGLMPSEVRRLRQTEGDNARLRRLVADLSPNKEMLQEVIRKKALRPAQPRGSVDFMRVCVQVSNRLAWEVMKATRSTMYYKSRKAEQAALRKRIRKIAETRVRDGYKRIHVLLQREGPRINQKRVHRLYREEGLQMRHKTPKRRVSAKLREDSCPASAPNECWSRDFMADELFAGRRLRFLTIVDNSSRVSPGIEVGRSFKGTDVVAALNRIVKRHGKPKRSGWTTARSFCPKNWICGPMPTGWCWTSLAPESQRKTPLLNLSTAG